MKMLRCAVLALVIVGAGASAQQRMRVNDSINGALSTTDRQLGTGEYYDSFEIEGRAGQTITLEMQSDAIDTYVQIDGPGEFREANDDAVSGRTDSVLTVTLPATGRYRVMATSYAAREAGAYRLTIREGEGAPRPRVARDDTAPPARGATRPGQRPTPPAQRPTANGPRTPGEANRPRPRRAAERAGAMIQLGQTITGALARGDDQLSSGEYVDNFRIQARRGERISIRIESTEFDTYAMLAPPTGSQIDNDDGPDGTNARIEQVLGEDGVYGVRVTSYRPGETGAYRLIVEQGREPPRLASVRGGPRVFAVMVGVSDYGGSQNDLQFTDRDATDLTEVMRRTGVLNPASITLTNADATIAGVRAAFARVAAAAGPDDTFMFFFSGHGVQVESATDATEPDGQDEVLVLRDGNLSDDDLAQMFGTLRTRLSIAVLDACFAGGFARDLVTRPGVLGLFSSEEDLTSLVAEEFESGGYLAHFLRAGLAGEADTNGDRAIAAGELAEYLRVQFNTPTIGRLGAETSDGQHNFQNFVLERGGVQVDDIVMRLGAATATPTRRRGR